MKLRNLSFKSEKMKENFNETTKSQFQIWIAQFNHSNDFTLNWIEYEHSAEENEMRENSERLIDGWDLIWPEIEKES